MRLRHRILILVLLPVLTGAGVSLLSLWEGRQVAERMAEGDLAQALVRATYDLVAVSHEFFGEAHSPRVQRQVDLALGRVEALMRDLGAHSALDPAALDPTALAEADEDLGALRTIVTALGTPDTGGASPRPSGPRLKRLHTKLALHSQRLIDLALRLNRQTTQTVVADLARTGTRLRWQIGVTAALVALIGGLLGWTLIRGIRSLHRGAEAIGGGDLDHRVAVVGGGELGDLAGAMNHMAERLQATLASRDALDLEVRQRRIAETALEQSESRLQGYFRQSNIGLAITSPQTGWLVVNPRLCAFLGYPEAELTRLTWTQLTHPDDLEADLTQFRRLLAGEIDGYELDKRFLRKDGWVVHGHITVACTRNTDGGVREVQASVLDITDRQAVEAALRASEVRFRTLVDASAQIVWTTDAQGAVHEDSASWRAFTGQSYDEWRGFGWLAAIHPDDRAGIDQTWRACVATRSRLTSEYRVRHGTLGWRWTRVSAAPLLDANGGVSGWVGMNIDITQERHTSEELRRALGELQTTQQALLERERLATIGTLAAGVAHEINNPLMGIINYIQFARAKASDPKVVLVLDKAERDLHRIGRIAGGMLDFSRPRPVAPRPVPLTEPLAQALDLIGPDLARRGILLEQALPADLPAALADPDGLQQVLMNLLLNARDALAGVANPRIHITAGPSPAGVRLEVQDNGPGIAAPLRGRVFDAFYTTRPPDQGTGLGLTVAAGIVQSLSGRLTCEPPPDGRGALFRLDLPAAPGAPGQV